MLIGTFQVYNNNNNTHNSDNDNDNDNNNDNNTHTSDNDNEININSANINFFLNDVFYPLNNILYSSLQVNIFDIPIHNITTLDLFIKNNQFTFEYSHKLFYYMYKQITYLVKYNLAISYMDIRDIMVINGSLFFFCNSNKLYTLENNMITINSEYEINNIFLPIEYIDNDTIPFTTYYSSSFYSLAKIIIFCIHNNNNDNKYDDNYYINEDNLTKYKQHILLETDEIMRHYKHTKLYFMLQSCLHKNPYNRQLLLF